MTRGSISEEIKAAVLADLATGEQPAVVARRYGLDRGLVKMWKQRYVSEAVTAAVTVDPNVEPASTTVIRYPTIEDRQALIADLVIRNLLAKLTASERIIEYVSSNPAWIERQSAPDVAELLEHLDRTAVTILDRLAGRRPADQSSG